MFNSSQPSVVVLPSETSLLYTITHSVITVHRVLQFQVSPPVDEHSIGRELPTLHG